MNVKHFVIAASLGLGLSLALLWMLGDAAIPINAAPAPRALSDATPIHYVAITGTDGGDCSKPAGACRTVQYAVDRAGEGDEVRVATGVYTGVSVRPRKDFTTTGVVTQVVYITKTLTVRGGYTTTNWSVSNSISYPTTLDAQGQGRVLYITGDISPTIEGLRITGGEEYGLGGGIYVVTATAKIQNNQIYGNNALFGAGVHIRKSSAELTSNIVTSNTAYYNGGGIDLYYSEATLNTNTVATNTASRGGGLHLSNSNATLNGNTVTANTANGGDPWAGGGGLYLSVSDARLSNNTITGNTANKRGGALYISYGDPTLDNNAISDNVAIDDEGGGLYLTDSAATLSGNTIFSNTAPYGGGLFLSGSDATLDHNAIYSNAASILGGGLFVVGGDPTFSANTLTYNTANMGGGGLELLDGSGTLINNIITDNEAGGLSIDGSSTRLLYNTIARNRGGSGIGVGSGVSFSHVIMTNTILVSQTRGVSVWDAGNTVTLEATLWGSSIWANGTDWHGDGTILTGTRNYWGDPAFVDPDAGDYHIRPESAALDKGVPTGVTSDIDGDPRPMGLGYDIGADETGPMMIKKQANPDPVQAGERLTYTLRVTNTGNMDLHATITDVLPLHITPGETPSGTLIVPGGLLTWTALIPAPGGAWAETLVVTAETGYAGPLTNVVRVAAAEGVTGVYTATSSVVLAPTNQSPDVPSNPDPADGTTGVSLTQTLQWQGGDPDDDPLIYTVAFGVSDPPPPVSQVHTTSYDPGGLVAGTTYYWAVTASDGISNTAGPTWHFTIQHFVYLPVVLKTGP